MGHDNRAMPAKIDEKRATTWTHAWLTRKTKEDLKKMAALRGIHLTPSSTCKAMLVAEIWQWKQDKETGYIYWE